MALDGRGDLRVYRFNDLRTMVPIDFKAIILRWVMRGGHLNSGQSTQTHQPIRRCWGWPRPIPEIDRIAAPAQHRGGVIGKALRALTRIKTDDHATCWIAAFLVYDLMFYVAHRAGHRIRLLWCFHSVHHTSEEMRLTTAIRGSAFDFVYLPWFFIWIPLRGICKDIT